MTFEETLLRLKKEREDTITTKRGCIRIGVDKYSVKAYEEIIQNLDKCIEAVEKQIPSVPLYVNEKNKPVCRICKEVMDLNQGKLNYCPNCGQKLWDVKGDFKQ